MAATAKISRPKLSDVHPRERLFERLDALLAQGPVWVAGPPGAGKTTLVASYLNHKALKAIWIQVDAGDSDPASLFYYLREAARQAGLDGAAHLPLLTPEFLPDLSGFTRRYVRRLCAALPRPYAVVLDNFHELPADAALQFLIADALAEIPGDVAALVISRADAPASCARLKASRSLSNLGWHDLRLTPTEGAQIAARARGGAVAGIDRLVRRCDGWAAGLTLLLEHENADQAASATPKSSEALFDYFASELFDRQPPEIRHLLLRTALLPWITIGAAETLTGNSKAEALLASFRRRHFFTEARGETVPTYEYHALFREFLTTRVKQTCTPSEFLRLTHMSAAALAKDGHTDHAIHLYLRSADYDAAAQLILREAAAIAEQGRVRTISGWIALLPDSVVEATPWLIYWQGVCRMAADPVIAHAMLEHGFNRFRELGDVLGQVLAATAIQDINFTFFQRWSEDDPWLLELERLVGKAPTFPDAATELAVHASLLRAIAYSNPSNDRIPALVQRVTELIYSVSNVNVRFSAAVALLPVPCHPGANREIERLIAYMRLSYSDPALSPLFFCIWAMCEAQYRAMCCDDPDAGLEIMDEVQKTIQREALHHFLPHYHLNGAFLNLMAGDALEARRHVAAAVPTLDERALIRGWYHGMLTGITVIEGDRNGILEHCGPMYAFSAESSEAGPPIFSATLFRAYARCALGRYEEVVADAPAVRALLQPPPGTGYYFYSDARIPEAYAFLMLGREQEAKAALAQTLAYWTREGLPNIAATALWVPAMMSRLFAFALEHDIETRQVEHLIRRRGLLPPAPEIARWPWPIRIHTLGRFRVLLDGKPPQMGRKAPKKLFLFLKALIALGGQNVPEQKLADALYPDLEGDRAEDLLSTGVHRLRKFLADPKALIRAEGRLSLNPALVWLDLRAFERVAREPDAIQKVLALYGGAFLAEEPEAPWAIRTRQRLSRQFVGLVISEGIRLERCSDHAAATALYLRGLEAAPHAEEVYLGLMRCYKAEGRDTEALVVYHQLEQAPSAGLAASPSPASKRRLRTP